MPLLFLCSNEFIRYFVGDSHIEKSKNVTNRFLRSNEFIRYLVDNIHIEKSEDVTNEFVTTKQDQPRVKLLSTSLTELSESEIASIFFSSTSTPRPMPSGTSRLPFSKRDDSRVTSAVYKHGPTGSEA